MKFTYKHTMYASFTGYVVQAIVNNFAPLLFLTFQNTYNIPLSMITFLITFNFGIQLLVDLTAAGLAGKMNTRAAIFMAHILSASGLCCMAVLPELLPSPFWGLLISVAVYAVGGGLLEVLVSPIVEACPNENKKGAMSILHSFYSWGQAGVVLFSTLFFFAFGIENWRILAVLWAVIPFCNAFLFLRVPLASMLPEGEKALSLRELFSGRMFWIFLLIMVGSGGSELAISQWTSTFVEKTLQTDKTIGDLLGTMMFAIAMGFARVLYGKLSEKLDLVRAMVYSALLCVAGYLMVAFSFAPVIGLAGCAVCGFSVGIFWPGTFSLAGAKIRRGGTAMFAILALAGDLGCSFGPTLVGQVSGYFGDDLRKGILAAVVLPGMILLGLFLLRKKNDAE